MSVENQMLVARSLRGPAVFEEIYHPELLNHPQTRAKGRDVVKDFYEKYNRAFDNFEGTIEEQFSAGENDDLVVTVWKGRGIHRRELETPLGPLAPTNRHAEFHVITVVRVVNGRIVERWGQV
jgi:ketosteroid isomerase-like protein